VTPQALNILMLVIQNILVAGEGTVGLVKQSLLAISGFWPQTNQHPYLIKKVHRFVAAGLQTILKCQKESEPICQNVPTKLSANDKWETPKSFGDLCILHWFLLCTSFKHSSLF
jgi:hypothetical protein